MSTRAVAFFIGLLTFFGPAITYFFETGINEDDGDMIAWLMRKEPEADIRSAGHGV